MSEEECEIGTKVGKRSGYVATKKVKCQRRSREIQSKVGEMSEETAEDSDESRWKT